MPPIAFTADEFAGLAAGHGSAAALGKLAAGQLVRRRLLLWGVVREARAAALPVRDAVDLLLRVQARSAGTVADMLAHPQVDAWAADFPRTRALGYLHALAAAAAIRAGVPFTIDVPAAAGAVTLPGLGALAGAGDPVRLAFDGERLTADGSPAPLRARRSIDLGDVGGPVVAIEDVDQYRAQYRLPVAEPGAGHDRFAALWRAAWPLLATDHPAHARAVRLLVRSFVPLAAPAGGAEHSASSGRAVGAIALALPRTAESMALLVLHETQHLKLSSLLHLVDLDQRSQALYHAPWRADPRPFRGLLQGTYAHLGVTDFWRGRSAVQFAYWHGQTSRAAATLDGARELTAAGARFVAGMRATLDGWAGEPVPEAARRVAGVCIQVSGARWRLAHRAVGSDGLNRLTDAWAAGSAVPPGAAGTERAGAGADARILAALRNDRPALPAGDRALLAGDARRAAESYAATINSGTGGDDDWAGLAVALGAPDRPELPRDLHAALAATGPAPDPRDVVRWCAGGR
ncbi:HEXXH motif domain-containing protein [Amorphoplanes nipponensis]|uniref:HEXXH motif domain-containing protein n=1 Tax=Actinoplanes nipponensis TaxID=135950 RepID=A0A919MPJ6_9ACTN|nr:HEXXH motif-containing putative peptide modification protein [Actinoplanes nipponensis]GIE49578.1 HEXXH motif domain-containing protein [Actinoplanes nipponensis]